MMAAAEMEWFGFEDEQAGWTQHDEDGTGAWAQKPEGPQEDVATTEKDEHHSDARDNDPPPVTTGTNQAVEGSSAPDDRMPSYETVTTADEERNPTSMTVETAEEDFRPSPSPANVLLSAKQVGAVLDRQRPDSMEGNTVWDHLYVKGVQRAQRKKVLVAEVSRRRQEVEVAEEMAECSFTPRVLNYVDPATPGKGHRMPFHERLYPEKSAGGAAKKYPGTAPSTGLSGKENRAPSAKAVSRSPPASRGRSPSASTCSAASARSSGGVAKTPTRSAAKPGDPIDEYSKTPVWQRLTKPSPTSKSFKKTPEKAGSKPVRRASTPATSSVGHNVVASKEAGEKDDIFSKLFVHAVKRQTKEKLTEKKRKEEEEKQSAKEAEERRQKSKVVAQRISQRGRTCLSGADRCTNPYHHHGRQREREAEAKTTRDRLHHNGERIHGPALLVKNSRSSSSSSSIVCLPEDVPLGLENLHDSLGCPDDEYELLLGGSEPAFVAMDQVHDAPISA